MSCVGLRLMGSMAANGHKGISATIGRGPATPRCCCRALALQYIRALADPRHERFRLHTLPLPAGPPSPASCSSRACGGPR